MSDYVLIQYSNSSDLGDIVYHNSFENRIYLDADVSKPEYEIEEDGIEDADGEFDPTFQKWAKKYSITFYAQEFLVDALTLMTLHDQIYVTLKNDESSKVLDAVVDVTWDGDIECWGEVVLTFTTDYIIKRNCDGDLESGCITPFIVAEGAYDADDDGPGQAWWESTTLPPAPTGKVSFFYTSLTDGVYSGDPLGFYRYSGTAWVFIDIGENGFGEVQALTDCVYLVNSGNYYKIPYIATVADGGGGDAIITCYVDGVESMFYQVEADDGGGYVEVGDPALASAFQGGYTINVGADTYDFRIKWYTHSCDYGYGNVVNQTIT